MRLPSFRLYIIKEDFLFKSLSNSRYLGMKVLPQRFFIENLSITIEFLNSRTQKRTARAYLVSITEFVSDCQHRGTGKQYVLRLSRIVFFACLKHTVKTYNYNLLKISVNNHTLLYIHINNQSLLYIHINTHNNDHKKYTQKHLKYFTMIPVKL